MVLHTLLSSIRFIFRSYPARISYSVLRLFASTVILIPAFVLAETTNEPPSTDLPFTVITFNTGTGAAAKNAPEDNLGYGREQARLSDKYYGNGLAWKPAIEAVRDFIRNVSPDIVAFQELFYCGDCDAIPEAARIGFVCEDWAPGSPTVAQRVLGDDYQIATHPGNNDKCLAVHKRFGRIRGCDEDFCPGGLEGSRVEGCGGGARVARAIIERPSGDTITVISYHGTSGFLGHDRECRARQVDQIFVDFGDGSPGVNGSANLILGDFNTDPKRLHSIDRSAQRWNDFVGTGKQFHFVTDQQRCAPGAYLGLFHIDHIVSDVFQGTVLLPDSTSEEQGLFHFHMFDHTPVIAKMTLQGDQQ